MKYPRINKQNLDSVNKKRFDALYKAIYGQLAFDNQENKLELSKKDLELLAWNSSTILISKPY